MLPKRRFFSLMEVMVALALVSVVATISVYAIVPLYRRFCFQTEVTTLYDLMQELQLEALTLQSDIKLILTHKNGKWHAQSQCEETVLKPQSVELTHIDLIENLNPDKPYTITFYPNGFIHPCETLIFSSQKERRWLDFSHPLLIKLWQEAPKKWESLPIPDRNKLKSET